MITPPQPLVGAMIASSLLMTPGLFGAGFQLQERSATGQGRAFSGEAAYAEDASVIASNPAAMIMLGGEWNYSAGVVIVDVESEVNGQGIFGALSDDSAGGNKFHSLALRNQEDQRRYRRRLRCLFNLWTGDRLLIVLCRSSVNRQKRDHYHQLQPLHRLATQRCRHHRCGD